MASWIKEVPVNETVEDKLYFIGMTYSRQSYSFWSRGLNGKTQWSVKPGIAIRYHGGPALVRDFAKNPTVPLVAIEVPADADKRWRARQPPLYRANGTLQKVCRK